tara:strand:- start:60036 stop:60737 length:702 start_codon:yes stop_codon:yes gene_type:complete
MRRAVNTILWTLLLGLLVLAFLPSQGRARVCYGIGAANSFVVLETPQGLEVLSDNEFMYMSDESMNQVFDEGIYLTSYASRQVGPLPGLFQCTVKTSYLASPESLRVQNDEVLTTQQRRVIYDAIVAYAKADPNLASYRPGQPPVVSFSKHEFFAETRRVILILGIPLALLLIINWLVGKSGNEIQDQRRQRGVCIHCEYNCADLPSPICPECGKPHADHVDAGSTSLPESNA